MSIREHTMYSVVCDEPGCDADAQEGHDFTAWGEHGHAYDTAVNADWQVLANGDDYCRKHKRVSLDRNDAE